MSVPFLELSALGTNYGPNSMPYTLSFAATVLIRVTGSPFRSTP